MDKELSKIRLRKLLNAQKDLTESLEQILPEDKDLLSFYKVFDVAFNGLIKQEAKYLGGMNE